MVLALAYSSQSILTSSNDLDVYDKIFSSNQQECLKKYLDYEVLIEDFNAALEKDTLSDVMIKHCP